MALIDTVNTILTRLSRPVNLVIVGYDHAYFGQGYSQKDVDMFQTMLASLRLSIEAKLDSESEISVHTQFATLKDKISNEEVVNAYKKASTLHNYRVITDSHGLLRQLDTLANDTSSERTPLLPSSTELFKNFEKQTTHDFYNGLYPGKTISPEGNGTLLYFPGAGVGGKKKTYEREVLNKRLGTNKLQYCGYFTHNLAGEPNSTFDDVVDDLVERIYRGYEDESISGPLKFYGHSMGGICSVAVAKRLKELHPNVPIVSVTTQNTAKSTEKMISAFISFGTQFLTDRFFDPIQTRPFFIPSFVLKLTTGILDYENDAMFLANKGVQVECINFEKDFMFYPNAMAKDVLPFQTIDKASLSEHPFSLVSACIFAPLLYALGAVVTACAIGIVCNNKTSAALQRIHFTMPIFGAVELSTPPILRIPISFAVGALALVVAYPINLLLGLVDFYKSHLIDPFFGIQKAPELFHQTILDPQDLALGIDGSHDITIVNIPSKDKRLQELTTLAPSLPKSVSNTDIAPSLVKRRALKTADIELILPENSLGTTLGSVKQRKRQIKLPTDPTTRSR